MVNVTILFSPYLLEYHSPGLHLPSDHPSLCYSQIWLWHPGLESPPEPVRFAGSRGPHCPDLAPLPTVDGLFGSSWTLQQDVGRELKVCTDKGLSESLLFIWSNSEKLFGVKIQLIPKVLIISSFKHDWDNFSYISPTSNIITLEQFTIWWTELKLQVTDICNWLCLTS